MKFILLVEGQTEGESAAAFLKRWLDPKLARPVGIQVVTFNGYANLLRKIKINARMHLEGPKKDEIVAVIGLIDLYGPTFYPAGLATANERIAWGKAHFEKEVGLEKFRFFFAVHEFEAWLLSEPNIFPTQIKNALPQNVAQPELVNFLEPPAKLLNRVYKQQTKHNYKKTTYGRQLFAKLDPAVAVNKCPFLKTLLQDMLALAAAAGL
jgi:hypothetical protein